VFSAQDQHVWAFLHWAHRVLAIFSKVHEFVQNRVSSPTSARFLIAALGTPLLSDFQQSARVCTVCTIYKTAFFAQDHPVLSF